jgi:hypothetical protein
MPLTCKAASKVTARMSTSGTEPRYCREITMLCLNTANLSHDPAAHAQNDAHASDLIDTGDIFHHDGVGLDVVFHEAAADFFHRDHSRLLHG